MTETLRLPEALERALTAVSTVGIITGAGISQESGIQTYRGQGGLYDDPSEGDRTVNALTGATLQTDPDRTWLAVAGVARQAMDAQPNTGHRAIVEIEQRADRFVLVTQNVDGLHAAAGSSNVIEIHGSISRTVCMNCHDRGTVNRDFYVTIKAAPRCHRCDGILRPDVVLFEEMLPLTELGRMQEQLNDNLPDLVICVGTTALFPYIVEPVLRAGAEGKLTIEVNPESTYLSAEVDYSLRGRAGDYLPLIAAGLPTKKPE
ncbi:MAG: Sir2 family NAD-dependent protein deacetylase [Planctomycetota bacterium]